MSLKVYVRLHQLFGLPKGSYDLRCYARPLADVFPFNLYAMIHKTSWEEGFATFRRLSALAGLSGKVLFSTQEFKKRSIRFFVEEE